MGRRTLCGRRRDGGPLRGRSGPSPPPSQTEARGVCPGNPAPGPQRFGNPLTGGGRQAGNGVRGRPVKAGRQETPKWSRVRAQLTPSAHVRATALTSPGVCGSHGATGKGERGLRLLPVSARGACPSWPEGAVSFARPARTRVRTRRLDVWEGTHHHRRMPLGHGRGRRDFHFLLCRLFSVNGLDNKQRATFVIEKVRRRSGC